MTPDTLFRLDQITLKHKKILEAQKLALTADEMADRMQCYQALLHHRQQLETEQTTVPLAAMRYDKVEALIKKLRPVNQYDGDLEDMEEWAKLTGYYLLGTWVFIIIFDLFT